MTIASLVLTDGTTTATLTDGTNYSIRGEGWAPRVAERAPSPLGGAGPFADVEEEITLDIIGTSLATMLANERTIERLLDQARRFASGDVTVSPVILQIQMTGGSQVAAMVLGGALERPRNYADMLVTNEVEGATLRVLRRGLWLRNASTDTAASAATTSGNLFTITLADHPVESPVQLTWTSPRATATDDYRAGGELLILSDNSADIIIQEAEGYAGGQWSSALVTNTRGGSVLRFTTPASVSGTYPSAAIAPPSGLSTTPGAWAVFAQVRLLNATWVMQLQMTASLYSGQTIALNQQSIYAPTSGTPAEPCALGVLLVPPGDAIQSLQITAVPRSVASSTITCEIDYLVFVRLSPDVRIIQVESGVAYPIAWANGTMEHRIDHQLLTSLSPILQAGRVAGTLRAGLPSQGDLIILQRGTTLVGVWMAGNVLAAGAGYGNGHFRVVDQAGALFSSTFTATRRRGYLVPE